MSSGNVNPLPIDTLSRKEPPSIPGKKDDFWQIWTAYKGFLLTLCLRWTKGNASEAQEILSGAMMQTWEYYSSTSEPIYNPQAWLARSVRNYCVDHFRKRRHFSDLSIDLELLSNTVSPNRSSDEFSPEKDMMDSEGYDKLKSVIEKLPERLREVMILKAYQDMPTGEIARHLQITPANVRKRIQEARGMVKRELEFNQEPIPRNRNADSNQHGPRSERRAADEILQRVPDSNFLIEPMAQLVTCELDPHRSVELPIPSVRKPIRIAQKLKSVNSYIEKHPGGWIKRQEKASLLVLNGQLDEAIKELTWVLERQPQMVETRLQVAEWLTWKDQKQSAIQLLDSGLSFSANNAWRLVIEASLMTLNSNHLAASRLLEQACILTPRPAFQVLLAESFMAQQDWKTASVHLRANPLRRSRQLLLTALKNLGLEEERNKAILALLKSYPEDPYALAFAIETRIRQDKVHGESGRVTKQLLNELKKQSPKSCPAVFGEVAFFTRKGKSNRAINLLLKALDQQPIRLQDLVLGKFWLQELGADHLSPNLEIIQSELFPDTSPWQALLQNLPLVY